MTTEKKIVAITSSELVEILKNVQKGTFANILTETTVRMAKTNNPYFGMVTKKSEIRILLGNSYQDRVNNNLEKEGMEKDFVAESCKVGQHVSECVLYNDNTKKYYLQYEFFKEITPKNTYFFNDKEIEKEKFAEFIPQKKDSKQGGLVKKVNSITVAIENIKEITLNKIKYVIS